MFALDCNEMDMITGARPLAEGYSWQYVGKDGDNTIFQLMAPNGRNLSIMAGARVQFGKS